MTANPRRQYLGKPSVQCILVEDISNVLEFNKSFVEIKEDELILKDIRDG